MEPRVVLKAGHATRQAVYLPKILFPIRRIKSQARAFYPIAEHTLHWPMHPRLGHDNRRSMGYFGPPEIFSIVPLNGEAGS